MTIERRDCATSRYAVIGRVCAIAGVLSPGPSPKPASPKPAGPWFKGNLHTHTLNSDGDSTPDDVVRWYREHGYNFVTLTDHNYLTSVDGLNALHGADDKFLVMKGEEVTDRFGDKPIHVNGFAPDVVHQAARRQLGRQHGAEHGRRDSQARRRAEHQPSELRLGDHRR